MELRVNCCLSVLGRLIQFVQLPAQTNKRPYTSDAAFVSSQINLTTPVYSIVCSEDIDMISQVSGY